jgi:hypothetical protein
VWGALLGLAVTRHAITSNRSSDNDNKIHETEALLLESKTRANDYLISQLLLRRYPLWRRNRVFTCPTFLAEPQVTTYLTYLPTYLPPAPCDLYIYLQSVSMPFRRDSVTSGHLVRAWRVTITKKTTRASLGEGKVRP